MSGVEGFRHFKPAGPVAAGFLRDQTSLVKMIRGPVGGGKSVTTVYDGIRRPTLMPACNDGIVRYRRAIIGITYGQLERNLYPTWWRWLPKDPSSWTEGEWEGGGGRFARQRMAWDTLRKNRDSGDWQRTEIRAEYIFAAIGELAVEEFMRGFEPTDILVIEADQAPQAVIPVGVTRLGRYPPTGDGPDALPQDADWTPQLSGDLNSPDTDSWYYEMAEENPPSGFRQYVQPGGLDPGAENTANLPKGYYQRQVDMLSTRPNGKHLIARMVNNRYAPSVSGEPVYADCFDEHMHISREPLTPLKGIPITLSFDQGLGSPACIIGQTTPKGQDRFLGEVSPGRMSARRFADLVRLELADVAPGHPLAEIHYCDPAGFDGADHEDGELSWAEIVGNELGIVIVPTETNEIALRLTAVVDQLTYMVEPGQPGLLISKRCKIFRKGMIEKYQFEKRPAEKSQQRKPVKNFWANLQDAGQYYILGRKGRAEAIEGPRPARAPERAYGRHVRGGAKPCTVVTAPVDFG